MVYIYIHIYIHSTQSTIHIAYHFLMVAPREAVILTALTEAAVEPPAVSAMETHGTGTVPWPTARKGDGKRGFVAMNKWGNR